MKKFNKMNKKIINNMKYLKMEMKRFGYQYFLEKLIKLE